MKMSRPPTVLEHFSILDVHYDSNFLDVMVVVALYSAPSRGGLVVERWSDNRLDFVTVGSNLRNL